MYTIFRVCRMIAWPICNLYLNLFFKMLMSTCAQVSNFGNSVSCFKQSKFQQKIHSLWKMWMLNLKQKVSTDAEDSQVFLWYCIVYHLQIGLFYLFWSCELRTNIDCTTKLKALYETSTTHLCMTSHLSEVLRTRVWKSIFSTVLVMSAFQNGTLKNVSIMRCQPLYLKTC